MKNKLMIGLWRYIIKVPPFLWEKQISKAKKRFEEKHGAISEEYRLVHHFVVRELPYVGKPLSPELVANKLDLSNDQVKLILDDLEKRFFVKTTTFSENPNTMIYREGQRSAVCHIKTMVEWDIKKLRELLAELDKEPDLEPEL